jgi:Raf kinase inhibitor-like YbhB/YbcL family protein
MVRRSASVLQKMSDKLGRALQRQRAGIENVVYHRLLAQRKVAQIEVHSGAFAHLQMLPTRYTADGDGLSPPLEWYNFPDGVASLALIVEDSDSPTPHPWVHAIAVNLDPNRRTLAENALVLADNDSPPQVDLGLNSLLGRGWLPPDPPPGHGEHRYLFQLFALSSGPELPSSVGRHEISEAILQRAIAAGCLIGTYERPHRVRTSTSETIDDALSDDALSGDQLVPASLTSAGP